jgi:hypothetical protein
MIMFGSFLPSLWSRQTTVYSGLRSRRCYEITGQLAGNSVALSEVIRFVVGTYSSKVELGRDNRTP